MSDYKLVVFFLVYMFAVLFLIGLMAEAIKSYKAKKREHAELVKENKRLKDEIYRLKFNLKLRGLKIDD